LSMQEPNWIYNWGEARGVEEKKSPKSKSCF
jgi:hypothetical protein